MSTTAAALTVLAVLGVSLPAAYWQIRQAQRHESERDRIIREAHARAAAARRLDPAALADPADAYPELDAHLTTYSATITDLYNTTPGDR